MSVSKAKKITGVITRENSAAWIELAKNSSQQKLEREVSLANPRESGRGRMSYVPAQIEIAEKVVVQTSEVSRSVAPARVQLEVGISERLMIKIRRAQGLLSQRVRRGATLEETLEAMVDVYLSKHDPSERAKRQLLRGKLNDEQVLRPAAEMGASNASNEKTARNKMTASKPVTASRESSVSRKSTARKQSGGGEQTSVPVQANKRRPLAAATKHRVFLKFGARCSHINNQGERCSENKFLEVHHVKPLHLGGDDRLENLTLLCLGHHRGVHLGWSVAADPQ
ncbi:MAG: HNH endonuclease [Bdellovibrionales bacterium]|nr:HNH endonuclease [Bdellovibrionales bacterium]